MSHPTTNKESHMKPFVPVLMTARERAALLAEFEGSAPHASGMTAASAATPHATSAAPAASFVDHMKAALVAAGKRLAEAGATR